MNYFLRQGGRLCLALLIVSSPCTATANVFSNTIYDLSLRKWGNVYTPYYPWWWNKAQIIAESNMSPTAVSSVGAMGVAQFMPATWKEMQKRLGITGSAFVPALAIQAQAYYMNTLYSQWKAPRSQYDKYSLSLAAYNAGLGNVLKAQKKANSILYTPMANNLVKITGVSNSRQTIEYVNRIWKYIGILNEIYESD